MIRFLKSGASLWNLSYRGHLVFRTKLTNKLFNPVRSNMSRTSELLESKFRAKDFVPDNFKLVYRGGMDFYIHLAHQSSTLLTLLAIGTCYRGYYLEDDPIEFPIDDRIIPITLHSHSQVFTMYAVFLLMMFGMRQISSRYVIRMYYNPETRTYRAIKLGFLPSATGFHDFQAGTLQKTTRRHILPWLNGSHDANGTKLIIFGGGFRASADYYRLFKD